MPLVTCPYCFIVSPTRYEHRRHLRVEHTSLFNTMVARCESGAGQQYEPPQEPPLKKQKLETVQEVEDEVESMDVDPPELPRLVDVEIVDSVLYADGFVVVTVKSGDDVLRLRYKMAG